MQYAPTRIHEKPARFHISAPGYTKNPPGFSRKFLSQDISGRMQYAPTRVRAKFNGFHISAHGYTKNVPDFILSNKDSLKTHPVLGANPCRRIFRGVCFCAPTRVHQKPGGFWTLPHDMARNPAGFGLCHTTWRETRRVLDFVTRHGAKPGGFLTLPHDIAQNPTGFGFCHTTWRETRQVLDFATRHGAKPDGFWTLPHDIA